MTWEQVREISGCESFIVGGHSHRHVNLNFLIHDELEIEVLTSVRLLKEKAQINPRHYSYPEGLDYRYSEDVIRVLKDKGIVCSPMAMNGMNHLGTDLFHLKRIAVVG